MDYETLKARHRAEREGQPDALVLRIHRALSWLDRAEQCDDADSQFIFLWIAFNAAYANEIVEEERSPEQQVFGRFISKLVELDREEVLYGLIWDEFSGSIRILLDNKFVFQPFWDYQSGKIERELWESKFKKAKASAGKALVDHRTTDVFRTVLSRMYTLRNQLIHGGATWNSSVNRDQVRDCCNLLGKIVPHVIKLMMDNPNTLWGNACYPVVKE